MEQYAGHTPFIQVSKNLANPAHLDPSDDGRSHVVFIRKQHLLPDPSGWYLLFPDVGLAIRLYHGACVSFDGRLARHCTSICSSVRPKDDLYGYFFGLNSRLMNAEWRLRKFNDAATHRWACGTNYPPFVVNMHVWVRVKEHGLERVKVDGVVVGVDTQSLLIAFMTGKNARHSIAYALTDPNVVIAPADDARVHHC